MRGIHVRTIAIALGVVVFVSSGCGGNDSDDETASTSSTAAATTTTTTASLKGTSYSSKDFVVTFRSLSTMR
jgi:hypothetical protein